MNEDIKKPTSKEEQNQQSTPGIYVSAGDIQHGNYDSKNWQDLIKDYNEMRDGDPIVTSTLNVLKYPALNAERIINPGRETELAKEAADYIDWTFDNIKGGFEKVKRHKLLALDFGISVNEKVWKRGVEWNGNLTNQLTKLSPLMPETLYRFIYDEEANFLGIEQEKRIPEQGTEFQVIPVSKLDILSYNEEFNDVRGKSLLRPARLAYNSKFKIIIATVITTQRGGGIPLIKVKGDLKSQQSAIQQLGRTIQIGQNSYIVVDEEKMNVELLEPKNQADRIPFLEYLDRQLFFNTLSQFMTAGIGSNGSRAATQELKAPYELAVGYTIKTLEDSFQSLINVIIENSYLANIEKEDIPIFKFTAFTQPDLNKVAQQLQILYGSNVISKQPGDELVIREFFNLPTNIKQQVNNDSEENKINKEEITDEEIETELTVCNHNHEDIELVKFNLTPHRELNEVERNIFEFESATDFYLTIQEKEQALMDEILEKTLEDAAQQLKVNGKITKLTRERELVNKLDSLYKEGFIKGSDDVVKELGKFAGVNKTNIKPIKFDDINNKKRIGRFTEKLFFNMKTTLEDRFENVNESFLKRRGGLEKYILSFKDEFKTDKRNIFNKVENGFIDGRGKTLDKNNNLIETYTYSAILDGNLCSDCAELDGQVYTRTTIDEVGLNLTKPVNSECKGRDDCRCILIPSTVNA